MGGGKNSMKTFTAAIIEALCDVRVKAWRFTPGEPGNAFHALKKSLADNHRSGARATSIEGPARTGFQRPTLPTLSVCYFHVTEAKADCLLGFIRKCSNALGSKKVFE
jgi:hypothetical protein